MVARTLALDMIAIARSLQLRLPLATRGAFVGEHVAAGVGRVKEGIKMLTVVGKSRVSLEFPDDLVALVHIDRQLVAVMALAVRLGPGRVQILLPTHDRLPVRRHRPFLDLLLVALA